MPYPDGSLQPQRNNSETDIAASPQVDGSSSSLPTETTADGEISNRRNRIRSLSNTFGDLFRSKKRVKRGSVDEAEEGRAGVEPEDGYS
jgi:hypothetical protein